MSALDLRPDDSEFAPFALTYVNATEQAMRTTGARTVLALLERETGDLRALISNVTPEQFHSGYAPGKWTLAESLLHMADVERVFAYRLLRIARGDQTPLPPFDHDAWVPVSGASGRTLADILTEIEAVRGASLALVRSLDDAAAVRTGTASGKTVSVRALAWMIAGHFAHHLELTRTRYLGGA